MKQMEFNDEIEYKEESSEEDNVPKEKKKISIVEDNDHLLHKRSHQTQININQRRSHSSDRIGFDDKLMVKVLESPSLVSLHSSFICPSPNLGVRSMSFDFPKDETLNAIEAAVFAEILREACDRLDLLLWTIRKNEKLKSQIPEQKLARKPSRMVFPKNAGHTPAINSVSQKLSKDWDLVYEAFRTVACELETSSSYNWLRSETNAIIDSKERECNLEANLKVWIDLSKRMQDLLKLREKDFESEKQEYTEKIEKLTADIDSSYCANTKKLDYVQRWEASRLEQQNLEQHLQEKSVLNEINKLEKAKRIDAKVSQELLTYLKFLINNKEADVLTWTLKYNDELEKREQEIKDLQEKIDELQEFLEESRILQNQRQVVIDEYLEEQRKIQEKKNYWNNINEAATLIQAIWRGHMVRHKLGPYAQLMKITKKKKKSKKSVKKAKKKKSK